VTVEKIILNARGSIELYALRRANSAEGGDWQGFCFCSDAQAWTRIVDMRHVLSRYCDPYIDAYILTLISIDDEEDDGDDESC
jgi:hypothetical protein